MTRLEKLDLTARLDDADYERRLYAAQRRLLHLRLQIGGHLPDAPALGPGVLVVFEGSDAGGKGGAIKRIVEPPDPRHYRVSAFAKPSFDEKRKHFLWRFWKEVPGMGGMALFDRSWYGRVLVERVEGYATKDQWRRAYDEIVQFERNLVRSGIILIKFWFWSVFTIESSTTLTWATWATCSSSWTTCSTCSWCATSTRCVWSC